MTWEIFGPYIKELRKTRGMKLKDAAKRVGISNAYLCQIENGSRRIGDMDTINKFAAVYKVPPKDIVFGLGSDKNVSKPQLPRSATDLLIQQYLQLSPKGKEMMNEFMQFVLAREKKGGIGLKSASRQRGKRNDGHGKAG